MLGCKGWTCCSIGLLLALCGLFLCSNWSLWSCLFVFILWQPFGKMLFNWDDSKNYTLFFSVGIPSALLVKNTGMLLWLVMSIRRWSLIHNQEQGNVKLNSLMLFLNSPKYFMDSILPLQSLKQTFSLFWSKLAF